MRGAGYVVAMAAVFVSLIGPPASVGRAADATPDPALLGLLPEDPLAGGRLFVSKGCAGCHAIYGQGGAEGPDLGKSLLDRGFLELAGIMWNHTPRMQEAFARLHMARPTFTEEEMAQIIAFVYFLNYFDSPSDAGRGRRLFVEKGCERCHAVGGIGGRLAEPLDRYRLYPSPIFISTAMWNNGVHMTDTMRRLAVPRPTFEAGDVRDILAYIRAAASRPSEESLVFLPPGNPRNGSRLFQEKGCIGCHAIKGTGWSAGPDLGRAGMRNSLSTIAALEWNHGPVMWNMMKSRGQPIPTLTELEMSDIVTYLYFIQYVEELGDVARGRVLFREKGCGSCHALDGGDTSAGPPVAGMETFQSPAAVIAGMWNHASEMERMTWEKNVAWPTLEGRDMAHIVAFLLSSTTGLSGRHAETSPARAAASPTEAAASP